jgi:protein-disulfide isomerase
MSKDSMDSPKAVRTTEDTVTVDIQPLLTPIALLISALMISITIYVSVAKLGTQLAGGIKTGNNPVVEGNTGNNNAPADNGAAAPATKVTTSIDDDAVKGNKDEAKVAIVEFSDFECPFCKRFYEQTEGQLIKEYVDTNKAIFVYRDLPLDALHPNARSAAIAAECAGEEGDGKYYDYYAGIFSTSDVLSKDTLKSIAEDIGIDTGKFNDCLDNQKTADEVKKDEGDAAAVGINGTPGFVVGTLKEDGTVEGEVISGAQPFSEFQRIIETYMK